MSGNKAVVRVVRSSLSLVLSLAMVLSLFGNLSFALNQDFDINVPELKAAPWSEEEAEEIRGVMGIRQLISKVYYNDIDRVYGRKAIIRMTALEVINNFGERKYRPAEDITGYEVISDILSLLGEREALVKEIIDKTSSDSPAHILKSMLNKASLDKAIAIGFVKDTEILGLEQPITKEQAAMFLGRGLRRGQDSVRSPETPELFSFSDWKDVQPYARVDIEELVQNNIAKLKADGRFSPKENLTRAEFATWLSSALDSNPEILNAKIGYGLVVGKNEEESREGNEVVTTRILDVITPDGKPVKLVSKILNHSAFEDYVTYLRGVISTSVNVQVGDEIEYIVVGDSVMYVGELDNGQVLAELVKEPDEYSYTHYGTVVDIREEEYFENGRKGIKEIYRVMDITGDAFDITVREDAITGRRGDIIVSKNGQLGGVKLLEIGDTVEYISNDLAEVGYIKVGALNRKEYRGTINKIEAVTEKAPAYITVYTYDGEFLRFPIAPYAVMNINQRIAPITDFIYGLDVKVNVSNGTVVSMFGESYSGEPEYIPPFGKMRMGTVIQKNATELRIKMANGATETVQIGPETLFTISGNPATYNVIKPGENVKVYYDNIMTSTASKLAIQVPEKRFDKIYKGKLNNIIPYNGELQLVGSDGVSNPEYMRNNKWHVSDTFVKNIAIAPDCEIYVDDKKLSSQMLERSYKGYDIYAVTEEVFGKETAIKISVKRGAEMIYSSSIAAIDHTLGEMEILSRDNFDITKATIVLKDGLLVPTSALNKRDTVFITSESPYGGYKKNAMFVAVTTAHENLFDELRIGAIENVGPSTLTLRNYTMFTNNVLDSVNPNESGHYKLSLNSVIQDISNSEKPKRIFANDFFHYTYSRVENEDKGPGLDYKRYYAFMVVNPVNNSIVALNMRKGGLMAPDPDKVKKGKIDRKVQFDYRLEHESEIKTELNKIFQDAVITRGILTNRDDTWERIELTEVHDYTKYTARWTATGTNIYVKYKDAIVIKNNKVVHIADVDMGDYLYVMRIGTDCLVIFAE